jgi:hypothetical protein
VEQQHRRAGALLKIARLEPIHAFAALGDSRTSAPIEPSPRRHTIRREPRPPPAPAVAGIWQIGLSVARASVIDGQRWPPNRITRTERRLARGGAGAHNGRQRVARAIWSAGEEDSMETLAERAQRELNQILAQYTAGEAEVVRECFARSHTREEYLDILRRHMGRELFAVNGLAHLASLVPDLERGVDRHRFADLLSGIAEEFGHYTLVADVAEWLAGRPLTAEEAREYEVFASPHPAVPREQQYNPRLPAANAMLDLLWRYRDEDPSEFSNEVRRLTEGGGGAAFLEGGRLSGDAFRERYAAAMRAIAAEELDHGPRRVPGFVAKYIKGEAELARATRQLRELMAQHLRVRNEMYGYPLSEERLAAIDRGEIEPWSMAAAVSAPA